MARKYKSRENRRIRLRPTVEGSLGFLKPYLKLITFIAFVLVIIGVLFIKKDLDRIKYDNTYVIPPNENEEKFREMVKGYPIERMIPRIARKNETVAAYMISIAKKESDWGKRVPVLDGKDCYNYWGYRGKREKMGSGGHTCFDSPEDAVDTVAKRIQTLVYEKDLDTPRKMIVWKCGSSCSGHDPGSVSKWISDVSLYFNKLTRKD